MSIDKSQVIPFPLPEHLASFISHQIDSPISLIGPQNNIEAKALHISRKRPLGKFILRCLKPGNKPSFIDKGFSIYISVSKYTRSSDQKIVPCRYSFIEFDEAEINEIISVFETLFRTALISFLDGAQFGNSAKKKARGKFASIIEFLQKYNLAHDDLAVERYRKLYDREKKADKQLLHRFL